MVVRDWFRLPQQIESLPTIWRRDRHLKQAGRAIQHTRKALTKMNIQSTMALRHRPQTISETGIADDGTAETRFYLAALRGSAESKTLLVPADQNRLTLP